MLDPDCKDRSRGDRIGWNLQTHGSGLVERALEYQFLAELTPELLRRGMRFEVLHGSFDLNGHDLVVEAGGIMRHIQLKCSVAGGKTRRVPVNINLAAKPSGCVVWLTYDPETLTIMGWRWFGAAPGERLPHLGDRVARHTRANSSGHKAERPQIRILPSTRFVALADAAALADRLFGPSELVGLRQHLCDRAESADGWVGEAQAGIFGAIPTDVNWEQSLELAMLIDGYTLAEELGIDDPFEFEERQLQAALRTGCWPGGPAELWITLFLEHRRWRFSSPHEPDLAMRRLLDGLAHQLRATLTRGSM